MRRDARGPGCAESRSRGGADDRAKRVAHDGNVDVARMDSLRQSGALRCDVRRRDGWNEWKSLAGLDETRLVQRHPDRCDDEGQRERGGSGAAQT